MQSCLLPGGPAACRTSTQSAALPMHAPTTARLPQAAQQNDTHDSSATLLLQAQASAICTDKGALAQASAFAAASGSGTCTASAAAEAQAVCLVPTVFTQATASAFASERLGVNCMLFCGALAVLLPGQQTVKPAFEFCLRDRQLHIASQC